MAIITIHDLHPAGSFLFADLENYLQDLSSDEALSISGGSIPITASNVRNLDDRVRGNIDGGLITVAGVGSGGTGTGQM